MRSARLNAIQNKKTPLHLPEGRWSEACIGDYRLRQSNLPGLVLVPMPVHRNAPGQAVGEHVVRRQRHENVVVLGIDGDRMVGAGGMAPPPSDTKTRGPL